MDKRNRTHKIKKNSDFLVLAGLSFFFCLWAIRDAWYPSERTLRKHPQAIELSFESSGLVDEVLVKEGMEVIKDTKLIKLNSAKLEKTLDEAKASYIVAKKKKILAEKEFASATTKGANPALSEQLQQQLKEASEETDEALKKVDELRDQILACTLFAPEKGGKVVSLRVKEYDPVEAGQVVIVLDPQDHFYLFNKSLAVLSFFAFWGFLVIHLLAL